MEKLHPGTRWLFRIGFYIQAFLFIVFFGIFFISMSAASSVFPSVVYKIILSLLFIPILFIVLGEVYARLAYNNWRFEFLKDQLKIEKGIIWKTYKSIPYERIQNVDINRGIIARLLGFSSLNIQTAGYSAYQGRGSFSEGYIPGVSIRDAEKYRDFLIKRIGKRQGI